MISFFFQRNKPARKPAIDRDPFINPDPAQPAQAIFTRAETTMPGVYKNGYQTVYSVNLTDIQIREIEQYIHTYNPGEPKWRIRTLTDGRLLIARFSLLNPDHHPQHHYYVDQAYRGRDRIHIAHAIIIEPMVTNLAALLDKLGDRI